ncbi:MAG: winged helix-turn-helix transcriptional regulator [Rubrivivax sp.]|nr:winged helix-turn-helix transcriptional regulator [Rubrivivax sp.]
MARRSPAPPPPREHAPLSRLDEADLHGVLGYQIAQAAIATTAVFDREVGQPESLRRVEYTVLALVQANPGCTARQLARGLAVTPPNITVCLDRLTARGLVERSRGEADARVQHLRTTASGSALARRCTQRLLAAETTTFAALSGAERAMLVELLHKAALTRAAASARPRGEAR